VLTSAPEPLLSVNRLEAGYGKIRVLTVSISRGARRKIVAIGSVPTARQDTLLSARCRIAAVTAGQVRFDGRDMTRASPREAARAGLLHVHRKAIACSRDFVNR